MFKVKLPFFNMEGDIGSDPGVESVPAAEEQTLETTSEPGVETQADAEPEKQNNFEKAFAKKLAAEREKWEAERQKELEKYKDYEVLQKATQYLQKTSGINDIMSLKEQLELAELQERAEEQNVPPEVLKRIDELEAKAKKAEEYERIQGEAQQRQSFEQSLMEFVKDKEGVDHNQLWSYMFDNGISNMEIAYKAMRAEQLEQQLANAEKQAVEKYLASKKAPRAEGGGATAFQTTDTSKMSWEEIDRVAAARLRAANQPQ